MKHHFLKISLIAFSALLAAICIAIACVWDEDEYYLGYSSNFSPEIVVDKGYSPLFYAPDNSFYGIGFDNDHNTRFSTDVTDEWYGFLDKKISKENIKILLLNDSIYDDLNKLVKYFRDNNKNNVADKWSKKIPLNDRKVQEFILFANVAVYVDKVAAPTRSSYWAYNETEEETVDIDDELIEYIKSKYESETDSFLKNRYWFQTLKAMFYAKKNVDFQAFFETTKTSVPKNTLYYRALGYLAFFKRDAGEYKQANIFYAEIFDNVPSMRTVSAYSFRLEDESQWAQMLQMATTTEQKTSLWALLGYLHDEERALREIMKIHPQSPHLNFLLTRLINKKESKYDLFSTRDEPNTVFDSDVFGMVEKATKDKRMPNPFMWNLAAGYMCMMNNKFAAAEKYYAASEKKLNKSALTASQQLRLFRLINKLVSISSIKGNNVENLSAELAWLYNLEKTEPEYLRYKNAIHASKRYLSELYAKNGNALYSELFNHKDEFFDTPGNVDFMLSFLINEKKSPLEKVMKNIYPITEQDLYQYKAVTAAFADDLDSAIASMRKAGELAADELLGNPFNGFIKDCNDCDHARHQTVKYSRLSALEKMQEMKQKIYQKNDVYNNALLLANAYYSITYYGNARFFWWNKNLIHNYIPSNISYIPHFAQKMLTNCSQAKKYYTLAFEAAQTDEQRAKTTYLKAKCERNEFYNQVYFSDSDDYEVNDNLINFETLKEKYAHTKYYEDVIKECEDFQDYVSLSTSQ